MSSDASTPSVPKQIDALLAHNRICDLEDALEEALDLLRWVTTEFTTELDVSETTNLVSSIERLARELRP